MPSATATASKKRAISFSALDKYHTCPRQYYRTSIKKDIPFVESDSMRYGKFVHKALEELMRFNRPLPESLRYLMGNKEITNLVKLIGRPGVEILCEQKIALTQDKKVVTWFHKDVWFRAQLDLAIIVDGKVILIDYKTGKRSKFPNYKQLEFTAAALDVIRPGNKEYHVSYMWTAEDCARDKHSFKAEVIPSIWSEIENMEGPLQYSVATDTFHPTPNGLCRGWCPVKDCEFWESKS